MHEQQGVDQMKENVYQVIRFRLFTKKVIDSVGVQVDPNSAGPGGLEVGGG